MRESESDIIAKWDQRHLEAPDSGRIANVLCENRHLIPVAGKALDIACGRGASALFMAELGMQVSAWDISPVAIEKLRQAAQQRGVQVDAQIRDVVRQPPTADSFDLILVSYFLDRELAPAIIRALRPGGLLFYQTFSVEAVGDNGPRNPAYRLGRNELLRLFGTLDVRFYREEGRVGDLAAGFRDSAMLVAEKPSGRGS